MLGAFQHFPQVRKMSTAKSMNETRAAAAGTSLGMKDWRMKDLTLNKAKFAKS